MATRFRGVTGKKVDGKTVWTATEKINTIGHKNINMTTDRGYKRIPKGREVLANTEDFIAYREKRPRDAKGRYIKRDAGDVTVSMKDEYGRWVKRTVSADVYRESVDYYNVLRSKRLPGGGALTAKMKNALGAVLGGRNDPLHARLVAIHQAEGLYKILIANGDYENAMRMLKSINSGDVFDMVYTFDIITRDWSKQKWDEMLKYRQNTDEYEKALEAMEFHPA